MKQAGLENYSQLILSKKDEVTFPANVRASGGKRLINALNLVNFQGGHIVLYFKHPEFDSSFSVRVKPMPVLSDSLHCLWTEPANLPKIKAMQFQYIILESGKKNLFAIPSIKEMTGEGISFILPDTCLELNIRKIRRFKCEGEDIRAEIIQNAACLEGVLRDFNSNSFSVTVQGETLKKSKWINQDVPVMLLLKKGGSLVYSAQCEIFRESGERESKVFVLRPEKTRIQRYKQKEYRSSRVQISPPLNVSFQHPLTGKTMNLEISDISGLGFSTEEFMDSSTLLPGLAIPRLEIQFATESSITSEGQVIYNEPKDDKCLKCGIAFLDIDIKEQAKLSHLLQHSRNNKSHVSTKIEPDDLWELLFETGFIYPKKYASILQNKQAFKETYKKLYEDNPHIFRHFGYRDKGALLGHISMIRFYERAWLIQHHAAANSARAGVEVVNRTGSYVNDFHSLHSACMDFVMCYFRPENRFPDRVFGGSARSAKNPKACSLDSFAYFSFPTGHQAEPPEGWALPAPATREDIMELEDFYEGISGGLALRAMDLTPDSFELEGLAWEYARIGFNREKKVYALIKDGLARAVFMLNISDMGLNLSSVNNSITAFVLDRELPRDALVSALSMLAKKIGGDDAAVLLYPTSYADKAAINYEKVYTLWVLNTQNMDDYFRHVNPLLNRFRKDEA
ncbi:MAG: hypothetical protein M0Z52_11365 [Actinomycetota bacterium]|nr:hypothetical protein [Actinomycetota bacterium]